MKKIIIFGTFLAVFLMISIPTVSVIPPQNYSNKIVEETSENIYFSNPSSDVEGKYFMCWLSGWVDWGIKIGPFLQGDADYLMVRPNMWTSGNTFYFGDDYPGTDHFMAYFFFGHLNRNTGAVSGIALILSIAYNP